MAAGERAPEGYTFEQIIKISAEAGYASGDIPAPIEDDFPAFGKAYKKLSDEEYSLATSVALERQFALNWLSAAIPKIGMKRQRTHDASQAMLCFLFLFLLPCD